MGRGVSEKEGERRMGENVKGDERSGVRKWERETLRRRCEEGKEKEGERRVMDASTIRE